MQECIAVGHLSHSWLFSAETPPIDGRGGIDAIKEDKDSDVTDGVDASGIKLQIYECSVRNKSQIWQLMPSG